MDSIDDQNESDNDNEEFFFESDHLALRGNADYTAVLRTIAILQAQRLQAIKDIDVIAASEKEALDDPEEFLQKLKSAETTNLPGSINVIEPPQINLEKYNITLPDLPKDSNNEARVNDITVRGRIFDQTKPVTFNQLWTCEEQRRLEELLIEYPPEPIEMRRYTKIARALGNRTTKQVASRLQKFFKKLHSAGMPVPGRLPKNYRFQSNKRYKLYKQVLRPSTFFPAQSVPVTMPEDDDFSVPLDINQYRKASSTHSIGSYDQDSCPITTTIIVNQDSDGDDSDNANQTDSNNSETNLIKAIKLMKRVKSDKIKFNRSEQTEHEGYKCDVCCYEPIIGTRWHCTTCAGSIDYCSDCFITQLRNINTCHSLTHKFIGLRVTNELRTESRNETDSETDNEEDTFTGGASGDNNNKIDSMNIYDKDYLPQKFIKDDEYNYLDPNFLPE